MNNKKFFAFLLLIFPFTKGVSLAQSGPIYDASNNPIGYFSGDGTVTGSNGCSVGKIDNSGTIFNSQSQIIGKIYGNGSISGSNDGVSGQITDNGTIFDGSNNIIGIAHSNGDVTGSNGGFVIKSPDPRVGALLLLKIINTDCSAS